MDNSILTAEAVVWARRAYIPRDKKWGAAAPARKFGVSEQTMNKAINRKTWKHVK